MKSYHKIIYRRARLKFWTFMVKWLGKLAGFFSRKYQAADLRLGVLNHRVFRLSDNKNKMPFPSNIMVTSTKKALQALDGIDAAEPTNKDVAEALKRVDKVRGDGKLPPQTLEERNALASKIELARGLKKSLEGGLKSEVEAIVNEAQDRQEDSASA